MQIHSDCYMGACAVVLVLQEKFDSRKNS